MVLANRESGPDAILQRVEDQCSGEFNHIGGVITCEDLALHAAKYKQVAGLSVSSLNDRSPTIAYGARMSQ